MNLKVYIFSLSTAILLILSSLLAVIPAFAAQETDEGAAMQIVLADNTTIPQAAPPPPRPPAPVDNTYPPRPPRPRPTYPYPWPTPPTPQPRLPYVNEEYIQRYFYTSPYYQPPVTTYQQPQVQTQPAVVYAPLVSSFSADNSYVQPGQSATLSWTTSNADTVSISPGIGTVAGSGSTSVTPTYTTTYTLTAQNSGGNTSASTTITVAPPVYSNYGTGSTGTAAAAAAPASVNTGGPNWLGDPSLWPMYLLLLALLAIAAVVAVVLLVRRPAAARSQVRATAVTTYAAAETAPAITQPAATQPAGTSPVITAVSVSLPAAFVAAGGIEVPVSARPLGRRDFAELAQPGQDDLISRRHLRVTYENDRYMIEDLGSTNGTRLNGEEIRGRGKQVIENGDTIELPGSLKITFKA